MTIATKQANFTLPEDLRKELKRAVPIFLPLILTLTGMVLLYLTEYRVLDMEFVKGSGSLFQFPLGEVIIIAMVLYMALAWTIWRRESKIIVYAMGVLFIPIGIFFWAPFLNCLLDFSTPTTHIVKVVEKHTEYSSGVKLRKIGKNYLVTVESWQHPRSTEEFRISSGDYHQIIPGQTKITVLTKPGLFDIEWITGYHLNRESSKIK